MLSNACGNHSHWLMNRDNRQSPHIALPLGAECRLIQLQRQRFLGEGGSPVQSVDYCCLP